MYVNEIHLATDLDGTLIGDDNSLRILNSHLSELRTKNLLKLAYITGRSLELYRQLASDKSLLAPDVLVTAVGTEIYWNGTDLSDDWPTDIEWDRKVIVNALSDLPGLTSQPKSEQRPYKVSYYLKNNLKVLGLVRKKLSHYSVDILYSHQEYLDILPRGINKGSALTYLSSHWNISKNNIIACGDSANDIDMLSISNAVIVGNARQELIDWVSTHNSKINIYLAKRSYAAGIDEGLKYFRSL